MKNIFIIMLVFSSILSGGQTLVPFFKANGKYIFVEYATMKIAINQEFDTRPEIFLGDYIVVNKAGKSIIIDKKGKEYLTNFDGVKDYKNGVAIVVSNGMYGLTNTNGNLILQPQYNKIWFASDNCLIVQHGTQYDFIDKNGEKIYPVKYDKIEPFNDYLIYTFNGKNGIIDNSGNVITQPVFEESDINYSGGLVKVEADGWIGYKNTMNELIIPFIYEKGEDFNENRAAVQFTSENNERTYGYINTTGKLVWEMKRGYLECLNFQEDYALIKTGEGGDFFIDTNGIVKLVMEQGCPSNDCITVIAPDGYSLYAPFDFSEGLAAINLGITDGRPYIPYVLFINKVGKIIIPPKPYDFRMGFSNGFAILCLEKYINRNNEFYIDKEGREYIEKY